MKEKRCVCGYLKSRHAEDGTCPSEPGKFGTMDLPAGRTCSDCNHIRFCTGFIGDVSANTECDWFPIRYNGPAAVETKGARA